MFNRGLALALLQAVIVSSLGGKLLFDRERYPRVWAKAVPYDPDLPIRGRYVSIAVEVKIPPGSGSFYSAKLSVENNELMARPAPDWSGIAVRSERHTLAQPVAFFIPEHVPDPSLRAAREELWVELTVPPKGPPRPIRLAVRKDGKLTPLALD